MPRPLDAALIDVGGTLWPNSWPIRSADAGGRRKRVSAVMDGHDAAAVDALVDDLLASSKPGDEARTVTTEQRVTVDADELIAGCLGRHGLEPDPRIIAGIRRAMAIPVDERFQPLPGAGELLKSIRALGLKTVIASNTYWRDAASYWDDFRLLGMAGDIDAIVTSIDAGHLKPHPAVFEMAVNHAGTTAERCVVIGNREENDIEPALALGMRTILVYPDDPRPERSRAHAVVPDLWACAKAVEDMLEKD